MSAPRMHPEDLERLADLVAERILGRLGHAPAPAGLVDVATVARHFGVTTGWVYENAERLGVVRLGDGPRARLRFDLERVAEALSGRGEGEESIRLDAPSAGRTSRARRPAEGDGWPLLAIRGEGR